MLPQVSRAGEWFLRSGIQNPDGGVARYYRSDLGRNQAVSTEITGYAASTLVYLHSLSGDARYLDAARAAAGFLTHAWDSATRSMPFEIAPAEFTYFFDCGIIVRGLLAVWRVAGEAELLDCAAAVGQSMARDFAAPDGPHPILTLPNKRPLGRDPLRWSRSPGCYQLKAGMAWWELWEATGETCYRERYEALLLAARRDAPTFLPGHADPLKVVDRLHAFLYFLEGLLPVAEGAADPGIAAALGEGIARVAGHLREMAPRFERSDVYAQLLRVRLHADRLGAVPLDRPAAQWEADRLTGFAAQGEDARITGGFYFGRTGDAWMPYLNPVSTAFALQALSLWNQAQPQRHLLI